MNKWQDRFDEKFDEYDYGEVFCLECGYDSKKLKQFIAQEIEEAEERGRKEVLGSIKKEGWVTADANHYYYTLNDNQLEQLGKVVV